MKIVYHSAIQEIELSPDTILRTLPGKAYLSLEKSKNDGTVNLLFDEMRISPDADRVDCNEEGDLIVRQSGNRSVYSVKPIVQPLSSKYAKAYDQFQSEYLKKKTNEIDSIRNGALRLYAVDQTTEVYDWKEVFKAIEDAFNAFKNICEKPKSHLKAVNDVRPIETVKRIGYESIPYLASHSEDWLARTASGLKPARLFSRVEDDEYQIYENRVVKTLIDLILGFLRRTEKSLRDQRDQLRGIINSGVQTGSFGFDVSFQKAVSELMSSDKKGNEYRSKSLEKAEELQSWAYRLLKKYRSLRKTRLYRYLKNARPVLNPLNETNILVMDKQYSVVFKLWKTIHNAIVSKAVEDESQYAFEDIYDDYLQFCSTLCGYAAHVLNFELISDGKYKREGDNIELSVEKTEYYVNLVLFDKEKRSVEVAHGFDIPIYPGEYYPDENGFFYDGRILSWPNDVSDAMIEEFCGLFKNKGRKDNDQGDEKRKYNALKSLIIQVQHSYKTPKKSLVKIIPIVAEISMENRASFIEIIDSAADGLKSEIPNEDILIALPICNENEQKVTVYAREQGQKVSIVPLTMFDINSYRRIQNVLYKHILKLDKGKCLNCGGDVRSYDGQFICDNCNQLTLTRTKCPNSECKYEYYYLNYDVSEETIGKMEAVKPDDYYQWDSLFQYKDIVNMRIDNGKIRTICPCCHQ